MKSFQDYQTSKRLPRQAPKSAGGFLCEDVVTDSDLAEVLGEAVVPIHVRNLRKKLSDSMESHSFARKSLASTEEKDPKYGALQSAVREHGTNSRIMVAKIRSMGHSPLNENAAEVSACFAEAHRSGISASRSFQRGLGDAKRMDHHDAVVQHALEELENRGMRLNDRQHVHADAGSHSVLYYTDPHNLKSSRIEITSERDGSNGWNTHTITTHAG